MSSQETSAQKRTDAAIRRPATYAVGAVALLTTMVVAALTTEAIVGPERSFSSPLLTWALWVPCLVAIACPGKRATRVFAALLGATVGAIVWLVGHEFLSAPMTAGTFTGAAFVASAVTAFGLCPGSRTEQTRESPR